MTRMTTSCESMSFPYSASSRLPLLPTMAQLSNFRCATRSSARLGTRLARTRLYRALKLDCVLCTKISEMDTFRVAASPPIPRCRGNPRRFSGTADPSFLFALQ